MTMSDDASTLDRGGKLPIRHDDDAQMYDGETPRRRDEPGSQTTTSSRDLLPWTVCWKAAEACAKRLHYISRNDDNSGRSVDNRSWLRLMTSSLNYDDHPLCLGHGDGATHDVTVAAQAALLRAADEFGDVHDSEGPRPLRDWDQALRGRGIDYDGNDLLLPQSLTAAQILPGLPPPGMAGSIRVEDLCTGETRRMVLDPSLVLRRGAWASAPSRARIWAEDQDWREIVQLLHDRGLVEPWSEPLRNERGEPVLAGSFGVQKKDATVDTPDGPRPTLRLIINLIPSNAAQETFVGDVSDLPTSGQLAALSLLDEEVFLTSMTDRAAFFYVFRLPEVWRPFMTLSKKVPWDWLEPGRPGETYLAVTVVGMGWTQAVAVCHHVHRNLLCGATVPRPLPMESEVRRSRPWPADASTWLAYIDDLRVVEIMSRDLAALLAGSLCPLLEDALANYAVWAVPGNASKDVLRAAVATSLGEQLDGLRGRRDLPPGYVWGLIDLTLWVIAHPSPSQKLGQVLLGRWGRAVGLRKAVACVFDHAWRWVLKFHPGPMSGAVADEFCRAIALLPLAYQDFRYDVSGEVSASDASESGGAVASAVALSGFGLREVYEPAAPRPSWWGDHLLVVSVSDTVGSVRRALDLIGGGVAGHIFFEVPREGRRVTQRAWPDAIDGGKLEAAPEIFDTALRTAARVTHVLVIISYDASLLGLSAFTETVLRKFGHLLVDWIVESMEEDAAAGEQPCFAQVMLQPPLILDAGPIRGFDRARHFATSWAMSEDDLPIPRAPARGRDLTPGCRLEGRGLVLDVRRPLPRLRPSARQSSEAECESPTTRERWAAGRWRYPARYFRRDQMVLTKEGGLRTLTADEVEDLLALPLNHTGPAVGSARLKTAEGERARLTVLARAMQCELLGWVMGSWVVARCPHLPAKGGRAVYDSLQHEGAGTCIDSLTKEEIAGAPVALVTKIFRGLDHRGSDVRMDVGQVMTPTCWPRQSLRASLWSWRHRFAWKWRRPEHINLLEARACLASIRWRLRTRNGIRKKTLHLVDNQVVQAVLTKKRSTAKVLNRVVRKCSLLELAGSLHCCYGFCRSDWHPADDASRGRTAVT